MTEGEDRVSFAAIPLWAILVHGLFISGFHSQANEPDRGFDVSACQLALDPDLNGSDGSSPDPQAVFEEVVHSLFAAGSAEANAVQGNPFLIPFLFYQYIATDPDPEVVQLARIAFRQTQFDIGDPSGAVVDEQSKLHPSRLEEAIYSKLSSLRGVRTIEDQIYALAPSEFDAIPFAPERPKRPSFAARAKAKIAEVLSLPGSLRRLRQLIKREFHPELLDENLWAFWGAHHNPDVKHYQQRSWDKTPVREVAPSQVLGLSLETFVGVLQFAMEIEIPIEGYQYESGHSLRYLLPKVAQFMGQDLEQREHVERTDGRFCGTVWCAEERRHGPWLGRLIRQLTGEEPDVSNPTTPAVYTPDSASAQAHFASRQSTEWSASSAYFLLAMHSTGRLHEAVLQVLRDEIKHLTVISSADVYLFGRNPRRRFWKILRKSLKELFSHRGERSGGAKTTSSLVNFVKIGFAHLWIEREMRRYLKDLPVPLLAEIFDRPSDLEPLPAEALPAHLQARDEAEVRRERATRDSLGRWEEEPRQRELLKRQLATVHSERIDAFIEDKLNGFTGAETPRGAASEAARQRIWRTSGGIVWGEDFPEVVRFKDQTLISEILQDRLREYQIRNNWFVRQMQQEAADPSVSP